MIKETYSDRIWVRCTGHMYLDDNGIGHPLHSPATQNLLPKSEDYIIICETDTYLVILFDKVPYLYYTGQYSDIQTEVATAYKQFIALESF